MDNRDIFEKMHEKMTPREEVVEELFARAEEIQSGGEKLTSNENGGITMSMNKYKENDQFGVENKGTAEVKSRRIGLAVSAVAAIAVVFGIGAAGLFGGDIVKDAGSSAPQLLSETVTTVSAVNAPSPEPDVEETTVKMELPDSTPEAADVLISDEEAKRRVAELYNVPLEELDFQTTMVKEDFGMEFYEIECGITSFDTDKVYRVSVPTGYKTEPDPDTDPFMTETAAGMALTDAGVGHDEFTVLGTVEGSYIVDAVYGSPDGSEEHKNVPTNGWYIDFIAKDIRYRYFIDETGKILLKEKTKETGAAENTPMETDQIRVTRIYGDLDKTGAEWTVEKGRKYDMMICEKAEELFSLGDEYLSEYSGELPLDGTTVIIGTEGYIVLYQFEDEKPLASINGKLYELPQQTWGEFGTLVNMSEPDDDMSGEENITREKACEIVREYSGIKDGKLSVCFDHTCPLTGEPAWNITLFTDKETRSYLVNASVSDPKVIEAVHIPSESVG